MSEIEVSTLWSTGAPGICLLVSHEPSYRQLPLEHYQKAAVEHVKEWASLYGQGVVNLPPALFADFGTISMAKPWGGKVEISSEGRPFIHPAASSIEEALTIEPAPNKDIDEAIALYKAVREESGVPDLGFKTPDFQGILNTAALVIEQEVFLSGMLEEPELVHQFLERVCKVNLASMQRLRDEVGRTDGNIWPYIWLPTSHGVGITEDMMPLLGVSAYREFGIPYLQKISDAFGGVFIHCCGEWARHAPSLAASDVVIRGVEFHHPFTTFDQLREVLPDVAFVPFYSDFKTSEFANYQEFLSDLLSRRESHQRVMVVATDSDPEALARLAELVRSHGGVVPTRVV